MSAKSHTTRVALVRILGDDQLDFNSADCNIGLGYIAAHLHASGYHADIFERVDAQFENQPESQRLASYDIVGLALHHLNVQQTIRAAKVIKSIRPETIIVLGGHHASATAQELLDDNEHIDAVCIGGGEKVLPEIAEVVRTFGVNAVKKVRHQILHGGNSAPWEDNSTPVRQPGEGCARVLTSHGCPYSCSFCTTPVMRSLGGGGAYIVRGPMDIVDELEALYNKGVTEFIFNDDLYAMNTATSHARALAIAREIGRRRLKLKYRVHLRVDSFDTAHESVLRQLKASGLWRVFLGVESGSDSVLSEFGKRAKVSQARAAVRLFQALGFELNIGNILVSPDSTLESITDSVLFFRELGMCHFLMRRRSVRGHVFPGTAIEVRLTREGRLTAGPRYLDRQYSLRDRRLNDIVCCIDELMSQFLPDLGERAFRVRDTVIAGAGSLDDTSRKVLSTNLSRWNCDTATFLLKCFGPDCTGSQTQARISDHFREYCNSVENVTAVLDSLVTAFDMRKTDLGLRGDTLEEHSDIRHA